MRSISSIITRISALLLALALLPFSALAAENDTLTLGMISVKTVRLNPLISEEREFQSLFH